VTRLAESQRIGQSDAAATPTSAVSVSTASVALAATNPNRVALVVCNDHATNVLYLGLGATAVVNQGIRIGPGQGHVIDYFTGAVNVIATGAGTVATLSEV